MAVQGVFENKIVLVNLAVSGSAASNSDFNDALQSDSIRDYADSLNDQFTDLSTTEYVEAVLANLGVTADTITQDGYDTLVEGVVAYCDFWDPVGVARGFIAFQLADILATLDPTDEGLDIYADAQTQLNIAADVAFAYSNDAANTTSSTIDVATAEPVVPAGSTFTLTTSATDVLVGTAGADTFNGTNTTAATQVEGTDRIIDGTTGDGDTANISVIDDLTMDAVGVENINVTIANLAAKQFTASGLVGVETLTVTRADVPVGGVSLDGDMSVDVQDVSAAGVAKVVAGAGTTDVTVVQDTVAGIVVDADEATGDVNVTGAATVSAAGAGAGDTVTMTVLGNATQDAKAVSVTTGAETVVVGEFTGTVSVVGATTKNVTVNNATGGATVNVLGESTPTGGTGINVDGVVVKNIDSSGATVTVSYVGTSSKKSLISIEGTSALTDAATVSANGTVTLDINGDGGADVDVLTLSGNTAAVTYELAGDAESITKAGDKSVTVSGSAASFSTETIVGLDLLKITTGSAALDGSSFSNVANIEIGADINATITVVDGQAITFTSATQTDLDIGYKSGAKNVALTVGDVNGSANTAIGTLSVGDMDAAAGSTSVGTVSIAASLANFTATSVIVGAKQTLALSGDKDFELGAVTALQLNATEATGSVSATSAGDVTAISTGSGDDSITANSNTVHTIATGNGDDEIIIDVAAATSTFDGGAGDDVLDMDETGTAYVVIGGDGADEFQIAEEVDAVIVGGDGSDTLVVENDADFSSEANFAMSSIEAIDLSTTTTDVELILKASQFARNSTFQLSGAGGDDTFTVVAASTGSTINASGVSIASGSDAITISYTGSDGNDTITGGGEAENFEMTKGADTIVGGTKTGKVDVFTTALVADTGSAAGVIVNMGGSDVTATSVLANTGYHTAGDVAVSSGTAVTLFNNTTSTNVASVTTLSGIEKVIGTGGNDYIVVSSSGTTVQGGDGADYIALGSSKDTVILTSLTSADMITSFQYGSGGDVLNVQGLESDLNDTLKVATLSADGSTLTAIGGTAASATDVDVILLLNTTGYASASAIASALNLTAGAITDDDGAILVAYNSGSQKVEVYHVDDESDAGGTLTLVGTLSGLTAANIASLVAGNFA